MRGKYVSLWVYSRGEAARDLPYQLWKMIEDAGDWDKIFWGEDDKTTRISKHGDLIAWMEWMIGKALILIVDNATQAICGLGWFSDMQGGNALTSIWMAPQWRGKPHSREATMLGVRFGYDNLGLTTIQTMTPWPIARNLAVKAGFKIVSFIPKLFGPDVWLLEYVRD